MDKGTIKKYDRKKYYQFHRDHGHDTEQCIQLGDEIKALIYHGFLGKYRCDALADQQSQRQPEEPNDNRSTMEVINMISGWSRDWGATFEEELTKKYHEDNVISFLDDDIWKIQNLHNDVVVVSTMIANYDVKKILIDNESSTNILFYSTFSQMQLSIDQP